MRFDRDSVSNGSHESRHVIHDQGLRGTPALGSGQTVEESTDAWAPYRSTDPPGVVVGSGR